MKKCIAILVVFLTACNLFGCAQKVDGSFDFVIYESDSNNSDLSDNNIVTTYHIEYKDKTYVSDTLIKEGNKYYFNEDKIDYLVMSTGDYGLYFTEGYFASYEGCNQGPIDVMMSYTAVNGDMAVTGISSTPLEGLTTYAFVINGFNDMSF